MEKSNIFQQNDESQQLIGNAFIKEDCNKRYKSLVPPDGREQQFHRSLREKCGIFLYFLRNMTFEYFIFFFMFGYQLNISCLSNMMMDKGCLFHFNYSSEVCVNLSAYPKEKAKVEILASNYNLYYNCMTILAGVSAIFIGQWSDKYGRKPPLLVAFVGAILSDMGLILCTVYFDSGLVYLVLSRIPAVVSGDVISVLTIVYSLTSEVSTEKYRIVKYTTVLVALNLGFSLGGLAGGLIYQSYKYLYIYIAGLSVHCFCFLWVILFIHETRDLGSNIKWSKKFKESFTCQSFTKGWKSCFKTRSNNGKTLILLYFLSTCCIGIPCVGLTSIGYIYVHHMYNWNPTTYNNVYTYMNLTLLPLSLVSVYILTNVFKLKDSMFGIIGVVYLIGNFVILAFSKYHVFIYYLGMSFYFLSRICTSTIRCGISKLLEPDEIGSVFAFYETVNSIVPLAAEIPLVKLFNATLDIYPCVMFLVSVLFFILPLGTFIWAYRREKKIILLKENALVTQDNPEEIKTDLSPNI